MQLCKKLHSCVPVSNAVSCSFRHVVIACRTVVMFIAPIHSSANCISVLHKLTRNFTHIWKAYSTVSNKSKRLSYNTA